MEHRIRNLVKQELTETEQDLNIFHNASNVLEVFIAQESAKLIRRMNVIQVTNIVHVFK